MSRVLECVAFSLLLLYPGQLFAQQTIESSAKTLPRVFIIGDSISLGYTPGVKKLLEGKAVVTRPATNCQHTAYGLQQLEKWLGDGKFDVIHFNWGIWDTHFLTNEKNALVRTATEVDPQTMHIRHTPEKYAENLQALIKILKSTGAKLIWASTTPIWDEGTLRYEKIGVYNKVAAEIMQEEGIAIDDLYTFVLPNRKSWQGGDKVHFGPTGNEHLARQVSESILKALEVPVQQKP